LYEKVLYKNLFPILTNIILVNGFSKLDYSALYVYNVVRLSANILCYYIILKIQQGFTVSSIFTNLRRSMLIFGRFYLGYKFCFSGRVTRRQRATYSWKQVGSNPLNTVTSSIDYSSIFSLTKSGMFGVKVWLHVKV